MSPLPTKPEAEETAGAALSSSPTLVGLIRLPGLTTDGVSRWRSPTAGDEVAAAEGVEESTRPLQDACSAGAVRRRARDIARGCVSRWAPGDRSRLIALDVVDACAAHLVGDLPRNNIISRVFYSTLKREARNWWERQQQPKQKQRQGPSSTAAHKGKAVEGADPALPGGGGEATEELTGLLMEVGRLRAEVRELRRELVQVRVELGGTQPRVPGEELELAAGLAAADADGPSSRSQPAAAP